MRCVKLFVKLQSWSAELPNHQSVSQLPWIPEHIVTDLIQRQQELAHLEQVVTNYQQELAAIVEEAQKDLMITKQPLEVNEAHSNFDSGQ